MATYTPNESTLDERVREAWIAYRDGIAGLDGAEYEAAETESWERLQGALSDIESERAGTSG